MGRSNGGGGHWQHCHHCGDVIGAYEPLIVETEAGPERTSIASQPEFFPTDLACYHRECFLSVAGESLE